MKSTTAACRSQPMPNSPFFRPSNPRVSTVETPRGTQLTSILVKKRVGEEAEIPLEDVEKKSSLLGAYANLCNICIGEWWLLLFHGALCAAVRPSHIIFSVICRSRHRWLAIRDKRSWFSRRDCNDNSLCCLDRCVGGRLFPAKEFFLPLSSFLFLYLVLDYSLRLIISVGKLINANSYETLMEAAFGRAGFLFVSLNMFFLSYGSMVAYLIIIKDVLPILFGVTPRDVEIRCVIMLISSLLVIVPLSMQRDMANLEKTSSLNVFLNICLVALVVGFSPVKESVDAQGGIIQMIIDEPFLEFNTFFIGFGVCSFAFVCQDSSFIIAGSMKMPSKQRWKTVTNSGKEKDLLTNVYPNPSHSLIQFLGIKFWFHQQCSPAVLWN